MIGNNKYSKFFVILILFVSLIDIAASDNGAIAPDYNRFEGRLIATAILLTFVYIFSKLLVDYLKSFIKSEKVKRVLNSKIVEYPLMICLSTLSFYIIGWGFYTNDYWQRDMLVDSIIICLIVFGIDTTILSGYKAANKFLSSYKITRHGQIAAVHPAAELQSIKSAAARLFKIR